jgi:hypothetical protein
MRKKQDEVKQEKMFICSWGKGGAIKTQVWAVA